MRAKTAIVFLAALALACLSYVLAGDFASGDIYPEYSSLRTDRMGTSALYEAFGRAGLAMDRNYVPMANAPGRDAGILLLNVPEQSLEGNLLKALEELAKRNNRLVIGLDPERYIVRAREKRAPSEKSDLARRWGVRVSEPPGDETPGVETPGNHTWFQANSQWTNVRTVDGRPTVIERRFGSGAIALLNDSEPFSNAALRDHRDLSLLTWAAGEKNKVVFDESHLGSVRQGTMMGLARRLRLQGVLAILLICALLFIWRASAVFPPGPVAPPESDFTLAGAGTGAALPNLLSRHLAKAQLLETCVTEWRRDRGRKTAEITLSRIEKIAASAAPPVQRWKEIRAALRDKESA